MKDRRKTVVIRGTFEYTWVQPDHMKGKDVPDAEARHEAYSLLNVNRELIRGVPQTTCHLNITPAEETINIREIDEDGRCKIVEEDS